MASQDQVGTGDAHSESNRFSSVLCLCVAFQGFWGEGVLGGYVICICQKKGESVCLLLHWGFLICPMIKIWLHS